MCLAEKVGEGDQLWPSTMKVENVSDFVGLVRRGRLDKYLLVWRGVPRVDWPLDSGLYRRLTQNRTRTVVDEEALSAVEKLLLQDARQRRFDRRDGFEMSDLELLASLQHHGAATRLLDVTVNSMVGLWFAVEDNNHDNCDGALFAIDVTDRELPADRYREPIPALVSNRSLWMWRPPPVEERIKAQHGAFIFSAVPGTVHKQTSLNLELKKYQVDRLFSAQPKAGRYAKRPVVVFRIPGEAKSTIRDFLRVYLGYTPETMFPDLPGFARARRA